MSPAAWKWRARARHCALSFLLFALFATAGPAFLSTPPAAHGQTHAQTHALRT